MLPAHFLDFSSQTIRDDYHRQKPRPATACPATSDSRETRWKRRVSSFSQTVAVCSDWKRASRRRGQDGPEKAVTLRRSWPRRRLEPVRGGGSRHHDGVTRVGRSPSRSLSRCSIRTWMKSRSRPESRDGVRRRRCTCRACLADVQVASPCWRAAIEHRDRLARERVGGDGVQVGDRGVRRQGSEHQRVGRGYEHRLLRKGIGGCPGPSFARVSGSC